MKRQTVLWTALPAGRTDDGRLKLSVYVSPRLQADEKEGPLTLGNYPDFLDWPPQQLVFEVRFNGGEVSRPAKVVERKHGRRPWWSLFGEFTPVQPYVFEDQSKKFIRSYPTRHVKDFIKRTYTKVGRLSPTKAPTNRLIAAATDLGRIAFGVDAIGGKMAAAMPGIIGRDALPVGASLPKLMDELNQELRQKKAIPFSQFADPTRDFLQLDRYFRRDLDAVVKQEEPAPKPPQLDFHRALASCADYPQLMRDLHMIFDLEVDLKGADLPMYGRVQVVPYYKTTLPTTNVSNETYYELTVSTFTIQSRDGNIWNGMLDLSPEDTLDVLQVDLAAAGLKTMMLANQVAGAALEQAEEAADVPTLASAGMSMVRAGLASQMVERLERAKTVQTQVLAAEASASAEPPALYLEDLIRGYRIDVWDSATRRWHPLCAREGTYRLAGGAVTLTYQDEGCVTSAATVDEASNEMYTNEMLFNWDGWSLAVPRPGKAIGLDDRVTEDTAPDPSGFRANITFRVPRGTLPKLRYGVEYRFRARVVDLAGNSVPFGDPTSTDFSMASPAARYQRFDPVPSPVIVPCYALSGAEAVNRMVIRSNYDTPCQEESERHIAPPRAAQAEAETHGCFDLPTGGLDVAAYRTIVERDSPLPDEGGETTSAMLPRPEAILPITYLPDPLARGAALPGIPGYFGGHKGGTESAYKVSFAPAAGAPWYEARPFRIRIVEGNGPVDWNESARILTVQVPKGETVRVPLSCYMNEEDLALMGVYKWLEEDDPSLAQNVLRPAAKEGGLWQMTPSKELLLIHAVQQPLEEPRIRSLAATRFQGETSAKIAGPIRLSGKSTGKVDLNAAWEDPVDDPSRPGPERVAAAGYVGEFTEILERAQEVEVSLRHELGDTKHHVINYTAVATSRYAEYFSDPSGLPVTRQSPEPFTLHVPASTAPAAPVVQYVIPTFKWDETREANKVTRSRRGGFRIYLARPWYSSGEGEALAVLVDETRWGTDPIWAGPATSSGPKAADFQNAVKIESVTLGRGILKRTVTAAVHAVAYDQGRKLWYADVDLTEPAGAYMPFVRLALARYQEYAVGDNHFSEVVQADFAQLTPQRTASIVSDPTSPDQVTVTITGPGPQNPDVVRTIRRRLGGRDITETSGYKGNPIVVSVETLPKGTPAISLLGANDLNWVPVPNSDFLQPPEYDASGNCTWAFRVKLPAARGSQPMRLVIREFERIDTDETAGQARTGYVVGSGRIVYMDTIVL